MEITLLHLMGQDLTIDHLFEAGEEIAKFIRVGNCLECHPLKLALRVSGYVAQALIDLQPPAIRCYERHSDRSMVKGAAKTLFAFLHFCEMPFSLFRL